MSQEYREDSFSEADLMYMKVALILARNSKEIIDRPNTKVGLAFLADKVDRMFKKTVNKNQ
jgi:hypothetical protein